MTPKTAPKLKYLHLKSQEANGTTTIGYDWDPTSNVVNYQIARCSSKDIFRKKIAHEICEGRMKKYGPEGMFAATNREELLLHFTQRYDPDLLAAEHIAHLNAQTS